MRRMTRGAAAALVMATLVSPAQLEAAEPDPAWADAMRSRVAASLRKAPDLVLPQWEEAGWSPGLEANPPTTATDPVQRQQQAAAYRDAYAAAAGPLRAAAARRFGDQVAAMFRPSTGVEPKEAILICLPRQRATLDDNVNRFLGIRTDTADERRKLAALRAKPTLSPSEAASLVATTCRALHQETVERRVALATERAKLPGVLGADDELGVPAHTDGSIVPYEPLPLVEAAAEDGIQVVFGAGWMFNRTPTMTVTPFDRASPKLEATLRKQANADGTTTFVIVGLGPLPGLRWPEQTMDCLANLDRDRQAGARTDVTAGMLGVLLGAPSDGSVRRSMQDAGDAERCAAAKAAFTGTAK